MAASTSRDGHALASRPPLALRAGVAQDIARVNAHLSPPRRASKPRPKPRSTNARLGSYSAHCPSDGARTAGEGPAGSTFRAKPFPEVTAPICRLPLPTFTYGPEASHLGDLMRIRVRPDQTIWLEGTYCTARAQTLRYRALYRPTRHARTVQLVCRTLSLPVPRSVRPARLPLAKQRGYETTLPFRVMGPWYHGC